MGGLVGSGSVGEDPIQDSQVGGLGSSWLYGSS